MPIQYAMIAPNDEVTAVISLGFDDEYTDGEVYNGQTARAVSTDTDMHSLITDWCCTQSGEWYAKPPRPNIWSKWLDGEWSMAHINVAEVVRPERNRLLAECDWTQTIDAPMSVAKQAEWRVYRKALRDLTDNLDGIINPDDVIYPRKP